MAINLLSNAYTSIGCAIARPAATTLRTGKKASKRAAPQAAVSFKEETGSVATLQKGTTGSAVRVRFSTHFQAAFGEGLKVVGSHPVLGEWDVAAAPDMQWTEGHLWVADLAVPEDTDLEFKLVHITYGGAAWEPSQNRLFRAGGVPENAALAVACSFGYPELTAIRLTSAEPTVLDTTWDPTLGGLPADITDDLSKQASKAVEGKKAAVTATLVAEPGAASWTDVRDTAPEFQREVASSPEPVSGAAQEMSAAEQQLDSQAEEPTEKAAVAKKSTSSSNLNAVGKAASFAAVGIAAGVVMSALAIDITDAAVAGAIVAAGATLLPAKEGKAAQKTASAVLSTGLNATEAIARGFGLKSHAEMRAEAEVAKLAASGATAPPEAEAEPAADDIEAAEKRLAASIAEAEELLAGGSAAEGEEAQEIQNNIVPKESSAVPSAGMLLAASALSTVRAEQVLLTSLEKASELEQEA